LFPALVLISKNKKSIHPISLIVMTNKKKSLQISLSRCEKADDMTRLQFQIFRFLNSLFLIHHFYLQC